MLPVAASFASASRQPQQWHGESGAVKRKPHQSSDKAAIRPETRHLLAWRDSIVLRFATTNVSDTYQGKATR
jgi:hypothetical protein